jgi:hypothetical protein
MALKPIDEILITTFDLPAGPDGKVYRVPECDAATGILCQRLVTAAIAIENGEQPPTDAPKLVFEGKDEFDLQERLLTPAVLQEMYADGLGATKITFCTSVILFWHGLGREMAEMYWEAGGRPEDFLPAANRKARRHPSKAVAKQTGSTSTAAASTTRKPASTTGTTSQKGKSKH